MTKALTIKMGHRAVTTAGTNPEFMTPLDIRGQFFRGLLLQTLRLSFKHQRYSAMYPVPHSHPRCIAKSAAPDRSLQHPRGVMRIA